MNEDIDFIIRHKAFEKLSGLRNQYGDLLPYHELQQGFDFHGTRVPFLAPQGIFKPRLLELPLSITTAPSRPYDDVLSDDGLLRYRYQGKDPWHRNNIGLRRAMEAGKPLIYLHGIVPGKYVPAWPVYVVADKPDELAFTIAVDDQATMSNNQTNGIRLPEIDARRQYITAAVKVRLHQRVFREKVLNAYRNQCALCLLRHTSLLDAAHIIPDSDPKGEPLVNNGLALCKLHHAAFDQQILGIRPDYKVEIRLDILQETDGPMLRHGLQDMHGSTIWVPGNAADKPDPGALEQRYESFQSAL